MKFAIFIILLTSYAYGCDCMHSKPFLEVSPQKDLVAVVRVVGETLNENNKRTFIDLEIIEQFKGHEFRSVVQLQSGNHAECREHLTHFKLDSVYLMALNYSGRNPYKITDVTGTYNLSICGEYWMKADLITRTGFGREHISFSQVQEHFKTPANWLKNTYATAPDFTFYRGLKNNVELLIDAPENYRLAGKGLVLRRISYRLFEVNPGATGEAVIYLTNNDDQVIDSIVCKTATAPDPVVYACGARNGYIWARDCNEVTVQYPKYYLRKSKIAIKSMTLSIDGLKWTGDNGVLLPEITDFIRTTRITSTIEVHCTIVHRDNQLQEISGKFYLGL